MCDAYGIAPDRLRDYSRDDLQKIFGKANGHRGLSSLNAALAATIAVKGALILAAAPLYGAAYCVAAALWCFGARQAHRLAGSTANYVLTAHESHAESVRMFADLEKWRDREKAARPAAQGPS